MKPLKPFSPPNHPSGAKRSVTSWTIPEPADVLSYAYLWHREAIAGQEEGLKDRPVVVVVAQQIVRGRIQLVVVPVTHSPPQRAEDAVEIPANVKKQLGLDADRSWVVTDEINLFIWPGPDVRPTKEGRDGSPIYGAVPPQLLEMIKASLLGHAEKRRLKTTTRTEYPASFTAPYKDVRAPFSLRSPYSHCRGQNDME
jgi:hypothetical protein